MAKETLFVQLLAHSPDPESVAAMGARLCYSGASVQALSHKTKQEDQSEFLGKLVSMGHLSPIEHVTFTFGIQGVSRALLAQITRHRIASFSVQSQRYVSQTDSNGFRYVIPPSIEALGEHAIRKYCEQMEQMSVWYDEWCAQLGTERKEDARFVLPNACETRMVMTMNARELQHMLSVRCCMRAQWEIRAMAWAILGQCLRVAPELFATSGPSCTNGNCGEGKMSCRQSTAIRRKMDQLHEFVKNNSKLEDDAFAEKVSQWATQNIVQEKII